ncbi:oocyte zinc finger protein XlCOF6-like [Ornithodoros turicata]|uniref:oocyte zinc finger protein XlCOF6-like n=1 Tax=Ornithodoros turicata TaxID=34597 RepID=UPI003139A0EF
MYATSVEVLDQEAAPINHATGNVREGVQTRPKLRTDYARVESIYDESFQDENDGPMPAPRPNPRVFTCVMCFEKAEDEHAHMEHLRTAHPKVRTHCLACETQYDDYQVYKSHIQQVHQDVMAALEQNKQTTHLFCMECGKVSRTESLLYRHRSQHFMLHRETCETCGKSFVEGPAMERHLETHKPSVQTCRLCAKTFQDSRAYKAHAGLHKKYKFLCELCGAMRPTAISLELHRCSRHPSDENKYQCSFCKKQCRSTEHLRKHMVAKHGGAPGEKTYGCEHCGKDFKWRHNLRDHILLRHSNNASETSTETLLACDVCDKKFAHKFALDAHMPTHFEYRDFRCEMCGMAFKRKHTLKEHINAVHCSDKKFQCSVCGEMFAVKRYLDAHCKTKHEDSTQVFSCNECPKEFKSERGLSAHRKTCHGKAERKHECAKCGRAFYSPKDRRRHELTHSAEKKHECPRCGKTFSRADNLRKHVKGVCRLKDL